MVNISIPEQRFRANSGTRYLENGRIRCHGQSKGKLRKWREKFEDYETPNEDIWPDCQCKEAAIDGQFVCGFHGGLTPMKKNPPRTIADVLPLNLSEKYKTLLANPDYISRKDDILLMVARNWELLEELQKEAGSEEAWGMAHEALVLLNRGEIEKAKDELNQALTHIKDEREIWNEIYRNAGVLQGLTNTQVKTAKELRQMATAEQVGALMNRVFAVISEGIERYIDSSIRQAQFLGYVTGEFQRLANVSPATIIEQLGAGDGEVN
jgi:hypothetical protein